LRAIWEGNSCLLSPSAPDTVRCGFPYLAKPTVGSLGAVGAPDTVRCTPDTVRCTPDTVWCTPDSPVPPPDRWLGHVSRADRAADRWPGRPLAHRTVRCTPNSPVNYSRTPLIYSRERQVRLSQPGTPDTVRCTTGESGAPRQSWLWLNKAISSPIRFLLFPALRHNTLVTKTMY
jgi:hypothetical protein